LLSFAYLYYTGESGLVLALYSIPIIALWLPSLFSGIVALWKSGIIKMRFFVWALFVIIVLFSSLWLRRVNSCFLAIPGTRHYRYCYLPRPDRQFPPINTDMPVNFDSDNSFNSDFEPLDVVIPTD
jgi:hypothetical protein